MKKSLIILFTTIFGIISLSEKSKAQVSIWPRAGINSSWTYLSFYDNTPRTDDGRVYVNTPTNYGYVVGLNFDFRLNTVMSIRPEIEYREFNIFSSIDRVEYFSGNTVFFESRTRSEVRKYISIPINVVAHLPLDKNEIQVYTGVYFSRGLHGGSYEVSTLTISDEYGLNKREGNGELKAEIVPLPFAYHNGYYNPFDFGCNFGLGYEVNRFLISGEFILGLVNTRPYTQDWDGNKTDNLRKDHITKNRSISLNVAIKLVDKTKSK
jgi:hypothetical protein